MKNIKYHSVGTVGNPVIPFEYEN